jgi:hypothetical protein
MSEAPVPAQGKQDIDDSDELNFSEELLSEFLVLKHRT